MIIVREADKNDVDKLLELRIELLKVVKDDSGYMPDKDFMDMTKYFFNNGEQVSVVAYDELKAVGCATMCFVELMPTIDHPGGKRAHIMNVYVNSDYRRKGIGMKMMKLLLDTARLWHITAITLDATEDGRKLYEKLGFKPSDEYMEITL